MARCFEFEGFKQAGQRPHFGRVALVCLGITVLWALGMYLYMSASGGSTSLSIQQLEQKATKPAYDTVYKFRMAHQRFPTAAEFSKLEGASFTKSEADKFCYIWMAENTVAFPMLIHLASRSPIHFTVVFHPERELLMWLPEEDVGALVRGGRSAGFSEKLKNELRNLAVPRKLSSASNQPWDG